jgi:hypothetical protein
MEGIGGPVRPCVYVHAVEHCVANRPPNPGHYRMLFEAAPGPRRLFHKGDAYPPAREGAKTTPNAEDMPSSDTSVLAGIATGVPLQSVMLQKATPCFPSPARS